PFHLCGNCFGGVIAFEMARQLRKLGHDVGLLALIDTEFPVGLLRRTLLKITNPQHWHWIAQLPVRQQPGYLATRLSSLIRDSASDLRRSLTWNRRLTGGEQPLPTTLDQSAVFDWNRTAFIAHKPVVYDGTMVLFCVGPPHDQRGWLGLAKQGSRLIELPLGDGLDAMPHLTSPPYVTLLAQHLTRLIEEIG
ncbi:MAG: thioesterase domain-containing protein, partial [Gammaproteobacteria bacterium]|nr:thioesterase domain-containing protein [Gammaproteobacteria bacterium]